MPLYLTKPTPAHALSLLSDIRDEDNEEWVAASGKRSRYTLVLAAKSNRAVAVLDERGECLAMWGVHASDRPSVGTAWMVATKTALKRRCEMHSFFKDGIANMHDDFPVLEAWAYSRNTVHHRWMMRMGFERSGETLQLGLGFNFFKFIRTQDIYVR